MLVPLHTAYFLRAGVVAPDWNGDVTVCRESTQSNHIQPPGSAVKTTGTLEWGEMGDEREVGWDHLVGQQWGGGQQSGFLEFLAHKGRMCVLATLRRTLMEEREEEGVEEGWRGCQFGSLLSGYVPTIVCQPGKHFQNKWRSGVGGDSTCCCPVCFLSSISDKIQE